MSLVRILFAPAEVLLVL